MGKNLDTTHAPCDVEQQQQIPAHTWRHDHNLLQGFPVYNLTVMGAFLTSLPFLLLFSLSQRFITPQLTEAIK